MNLLEEIACEGEPHPGKGTNVSLCRIAKFLLLGFSVRQMDMLVD